MKRLLVGALVLATGIAAAFAAAAVGGSAVAATASSYRLPPAGQDQWYWQIGGGNLPATTGAYPAPASANIWDTDDFDDAGTMGANDEPDGPSSLVGQLHASGKYSICYIEAGAQQPEPDSSHFAAADYTNGSASTTQMDGYPDEYWYDIRGFAGYQAGNASTLTGAAVNIAAGLAQRIEGCAAEGQDAIEPDDLDGYTNASASGAKGGGWGLTQADAAGFERWLAYTAHSDGLAAFQKNDGANTAADEPVFDGMIIEECNHYDDPCTGASGDDVNLYVSAGKPVLNAEYTEDGETTAKFCSADKTAGITGALFNVDLDGKTYQPCAPVGSTSSTTSTTTSSTSTATSSSSTETTTATTTSSTSTQTTSSSPTTTTSSTTTTPPSQKPVNTKAPTLSGTAKQGDQFKTSNGTWTGNPAKFTYAWRRCQSNLCQTVKGASRQTYNLGSGDVGYRLQAVVTATDKAGSASAVTDQSAVVVKKPKARAARHRKAKGGQR